MISSARSSVDAITVELTGGAFAGLGATCEEDYLELWHKRVAPRPDLLSLAAVGGACADRLAWVFIAGYQAAIRHTFSKVDVNGWLAFAVSEDRNSPQRLPGVSLSAQAASSRLNGYKTWVAAAEHVSALIVKADRGPAARYFLLERSIPGLEIVAKPKGRFLADLSQGVAYLENVAVDATAPLDDAEVRNFGVREAVYIYCAFCGFILAKSADTSLRAHSAKLLAHAVVVLEDPLDLTGLKAFDADMQALVARVEPGSCQLQGDWLEDQRLLTMYSPGIQQK